MKTILARLIFLPLFIHGISAVQDVYSSDGRYKYSIDGRGEFIDRRLEGTYDPAVYSPPPPPRSSPKYYSSRSGKKRSGGLGGILKSTASGLAEIGVDVARHSINDLRYQQGQVRSGRAEKMNLTEALANGAINAYKQYRRRKRQID